MQITIIVPMYEGMFDGDYPVLVKKGHLTLEQADAFAAQYGPGYSDRVTVAVEDGFFSTFANHANATRDEDGNIAYDERGHLSLTFQHAVVD